MKNFTRLAILVAAFALSACAHEEKPDTRPQSFAAADINHDERLSYGEYQSYLNYRAIENDEDARHVMYDADPQRDKTILIKFQKSDLNRDTFVTRDEVFQ